MVKTDIRKNYPSGKASSTVTRVERNCDALKRCLDDIVTNNEYRNEQVLKASRYMSLTLSSEANNNIFSAVISGSSNSALCGQGSQTEYNSIKFGYQF